MDKRLLNKNFILSTLGSAFVYIASSMIISVLPQYSAGNQYSKIIISTFMLAFTLSACVTRILWGILSNKIGRKKVIIIGVVLTLSALALLVLNKTIMLILLSRILFGAGFSAVVTACATLATETSDKSLVPQAIAIYGLGGVLTQAIAPPLGLWLYNYGFSIVIYTAIIISVVSGVLSFFIKEKSAIIKYTKTDIFDKSAISYSFVAGFITFATASIFTFIPLLAVETQIKNVTGFFVLNAIGLLLARLVFSKISGKVSFLKIFYIGSAVFIASFFLLFISKTSVALTVCGALYGGGMGLIHPVINTVAVKDKKNRAGAMAVFYTLQDIGLASGSLACGIIGESFGIKAVFLLCAVSAILALLLFYILNKKYCKG